MRLKELRLFHSSEGPHLDTSNQSTLARDRCELGGLLRRPNRLDVHGIEVVLWLDLEQLALEAVVASRALTRLTHSRQFWIR